MITTGQVPDEASLLVTTRFACGVQASLIVKPIVSSVATVVTAAGAALAEHPSTSETVIVPVITGGVLSFGFMVIICVTETLFPHPSFIV